MDILHIVGVGRMGREMMVRRAWRDVILFGAATLFATCVGAADGDSDAATTNHATAPAYVRLAYQPTTAISMLDLPGHFFAAQVMSVSSQERLEDYVSRNALVGVSGARVAQGGELRYVLLLGIYETRALAQQATQGLPPPLNELGVWIRSMGQLQRAIVSGDELAWAQSN